MTGAWLWLTAARPAGMWFVGTAMAMLGLGLLMVRPDSASSVSISGIVCAILAAAFFSAQVLAIESIGSQWANSAALAWMFLISAVALGPVGGAGMWRGQPPSTADVLVIAYVCVVTAGVAYRLFAAGMKHLGAAAAATICLLEPAGAVLLAVVFLGERQSPVQWIGMSLLVASLAVVSRSPRWRPSLRPSASPGEPASWPSSLRRR